MDRSWKSNRRSRRRRHSRNAVLAALAWAVGAFVATAGANAALGPWLRDPLYADKESELQRRITTSARSPDNLIVMFGSSRTANGLIGAEFEAVWRERAGEPVAAFNFGVPSCGPITQFLHLRRLLANGLRPNLVLLEVMPPLLAGQVPAPPEHHFHAPERLLPSEVDLVLSRGYPPEPTSGRAEVATWCPIYALRLPILGRVFPSWSPWNLRFDSSRHCDDSGWLRPVFDTVSDAQRQQGFDRACAEYADLLRSLTLDGPAAQAIFDCVDACNDAGIPIVLVLMPESANFRALYSMSAEQALRDFVSRARERAPVIDARCWLHEQAFSDGHHMLARGAIQFSRRLAEELASTPLVIHR